MSKRRAAFTLIELLVVVAIIALLISILLPSLARAREQTKSVKCLANLRSLGQGIVSYSTQSADSLPGPLHPALYRNSGIDYIMEKNGWSHDRALWWQGRYLTGKLRQVMSDSSTRENSVTDQVATCPSMVSIVPDAGFTDGRHPVHYAVNNWGTGTGDGDQSGGIGNLRLTSPEHYFGLSLPNYPQSDADRALERKNPPQPITKVKNPSEEWAVADAWYRARGSGFQEFQQEGTFQTAWTGEYLPYWAPHFARLGTYTKTSDRSAQASQVRASKADGNTNSVFFDGHAASVRSRTYKAAAFDNLLYGFPGTKNPRKKSPPPNNAIWTGYWY
jgi:prepilin-type N-terminal cleavage/methylation domain-containing protein